jgi:hypothetical protein
VFEQAIVSASACLVNARGVAASDKISGILHACACCGASENEPETP